MTFINRIAIIDDHVSFAKGIQRILTIDNPTYEVEIFMSSPNDLKELCIFNPDLLILDLSNPSVDGIHLLTELTESLTGVKKVVLTSDVTKKEVLLSFQIGVEGYIPKSISMKVLMDAVETILNGKTYFHPLASEFLVKELLSKQPLQAPIEESTKVLPGLSKREQQVLHLMAQGLSNYEIGKKLFLTDSTVAKYVSLILKKLDVSTRTEAVVKVLKMGWINKDQHYQSSRFLPNSP